RSSRELVLTALRERGAMSRAELARYAQVAPSTISAVVQDLVAGGVVVGSGECDLPDGHASAEGLAAARRLMDETLTAAGLSHGALIGAGVSLPGPIRHDPGAPDAVKPSGVLPGWHGVTGPDVEQALGVPVSIDNDANLAALGEHLWGAGRGCDDCVTVKFHYGIGCGLFVNGALVRGAV